MIEKIKLRWMLPVVMTAVQLGLFVIASEQEKKAAEHSALAYPVVRAAVIQEEQTVSFQPMAPPPVPFSTAAAFILNLPAMLLGATLASIVHWPDSDATFIGSSVLFVPLIWFAIGRWLDRQIAPSGITRRRIWSQVCQWALRAVALLGIIAWLAYRGGWEGQDDPSYIPLALWCTWYLFCSFWGESRLRRLHLEGIGA
jgi:hypothetical protein